MPRLSVGDCIRFGWETFKKRPGLLIGAFFLAFFIPSIPGIVIPGPQPLPDGTIPPPTSVQTLSMLASLVLGIFATLGIITFSLRAHDNVEQVSLNDLWNPAPFWSYFFAQVLLTVICAVGLLLFIVPGVILGVELGLTPYLVVDRLRGPIDALKESWNLTRGNRWQLFFLMLAVIGLHLLGFIALLVGVLVAAPVSWLAMTHAYRTLSAGR